MEITSDILDLVRRFMAELIPFNAFLGIEVEELEQGRAVLRIPFRPEYIGDASRPALHGGLISTLIDTCGGAAVWTTVNLTDRVSTIDLRVDYLRPGRPEPLVAEGRVIRVGNRVGVVTIRAWHPSTPAETVAEGKGVYNIKRGSKEVR
jgi:uncharacterized protein (TIGR00369 family)